MYMANVNSLVSHTVVQVILSVSISLYTVEREDSF
jgi:hypothetical protein